MDNVMNLTGGMDHSGEGCAILALALDYALQKSWNCLHAQLLLQQGKRSL